MAPGIAEALLATALGLFAAIPSVVFYNIFQTRITAYGTRAEGFVAELINAISVSSTEGRKVHGGQLAGPGGSSSRFQIDQNSEINVTPFVDVMLVLLIIFMSPPRSPR